MEKNFDRNVYLALEEVSNQVLKKTLSGPIIQRIDTNIGDNEQISITLEEHYDSGEKSQDIDVQRRVFISEDKSDSVALEIDSNTVQEWTGKIVQDFLNQEKDPLKEISITEIQNIVDNSFTDFDLPIPEFRIQSNTGDSIMASEGFLIHSAPGKLYASKLFPKRLFADRLELLVSFNGNNGKNGYLISNLQTPILSSVLFLMLTVILFIVLIRKYQGQKKLADIRSELINSMSHELKTPVSTIRIANANLKSGKGDSSQLIHIIEEENQRMESHINAVLELSKAESGMLAKSLKGESLKALLNEIISKHKHIHPNFEAEEPLDVKVSVHQESFRNAIENILDNAYKYSGDSAPVKLKTQLKGNWVCIEIEDKGIGIPSNEYNNIFESFYRITDGDKYTIAGTGLGLSYARKAIEAQGGTIEVHSEVGKGSRFIIKIPTL